MEREEFVKLIKDLEIRIVRFDNTYLKIELFYDKEFISGDICSVPDLSKPQSDW